MVASQFDPAHWVTYTRVVRRLVAILLGLILASTVGQVSALHIHAYADHDHPEHQHGLATHEHNPSASHHDDDGLRLESCDPGQHAVPLVMDRTPLPQVQSIQIECPTPISVEPLLPLRSVSDVTEVRVHGPPPRTQAPPRAPPLNLHA
jgi:hypothetical protein